MSWLGKAYAILWIAKNQHTFVHQDPMASRHNNFLRADRYEIRLAFLGNSAVQTYRRRTRGLFYFSHLLMNFLFTTSTIILFVMSLENVWPRAIKNFIQLCHILSFKNFNGEGGFGTNISNTPRKLMMSILFFSKLVNL